MSKHKDEIYADRNATALALLRALHEIGYQVHYRKTDEYKYPTVGAVLMNGEAGWHIPRNEDDVSSHYDGPFFEEHAQWLLEAEYPYDHHTREEKNSRLIEFAMNYPTITD